MKKLFLISISLIMTVCVFGQASKYQPKVIGMFLGEKSPHFDESRFPDIDFYYVVKKNYKNPEGMLEGFGANTGLVFDKNGLLVTMSRDLSVHMGVCYANYSTTKKGEFTNLDVLAKEYVKKGGEMKPGKKFKAKHPERISSYYIGFGIPDFKVENSEGKSISFNSLVKDNPLTLVAFIHLDNDDDGAKGLESGADKSGKQFIKDIDQTYRFEKQIKALISIEKEIFGKKTNL